MNRLFVLAGCMLSMLLTVGCVEAETSSKEEIYPDFSWDTLPVCLHFSKLEDDFTPEEIEFIAKYPFVCIEKNQATDKYNDARIGTAVAAEAIKKANPRSKVLFYWNTRIDFGENYFGYNILDDEHHPEWIMKDLEGNDVKIRGRKTTYDASNAEFRDWWLTIPVDMLQSCKYIDGVYLDAMPHYLREREKLEAAWGVEKVQGIRDGVLDMTSRLREQLGDDKIIVANSIHAISDFDTGVQQYLDGSMIELFCCDLPSYSLEDHARQIEIVQDAGRRGRIMMVKCWPRYYFLRPGEYKDLTYEQMVQDSRDDIDFPLACYLIAAGKYAYFCYSWGYFENQGGMAEYPEYSKPLGEPEGEAVRDGWKYSRRFEHAYVTMDLENRTSNIEWF